MSATTVSIVCFIFAAISFIWGLVTEYRQSRAEGPIAIVPTLPFAVAAGIFVTFGLAWLHLDIPFWIHFIVFFGSSALFIFAIVNASGTGRAD